METQQEEKEFNLLYEPWILVKTRQNETKEWSLLDIFQHAHEAQQLAGELPTQDMAIMRLLLAIMHGVFVTSDVEDAEDARNLWQELWERKQFPYSIMERYLKQYAERFWLFHPEYPFYQVVDMVDVMNCYKKAKGKKTKDEEKLKTVARLIGDLFQSDHVPRLFPGRNGEQKYALDYAEAARWLLHLNGFDDDSAKNPTPKGVGFLGQLGLVYAQGKNLFETLMLNFVLLNNNNKLFDDGKKTAKAYWEKPVCKTVENLISQPTAQKELLTMQSRRILLKRESGKIIGYLLTMGDYFDKDQGFFNEQMTLWKLDEKKGFIPNRHSPERQIWRGFSSLISNGGNSNNRDSGLIHWLQVLQDQGIISADIIRICIVGIHYKLKGAGWQPVDFINDSLRVNSGVLGMLGVTWVDGIIRILSLTDKSISILGWLAVDIAIAEGDSSKDHTEIGRAAREQGYNQLDGAFRNWLLSVDPQKNNNIEIKMAEWLEIAKKLIRMQAEKILEQCSDKAIVGCMKKVKDKNMNEKTENVNGLKALIKFQAGINQVLG